MTRRRELKAPIAPGGTIGILGGGQLGRMLALAAARLGFRTHVYSPPDEDSPAFHVSDAQTRAPFDDRPSLEAFARSCDVVTFEWENVPVDSLDVIAAEIPTFPDAKTLRVTQDRLEEKSFLVSLGLRTAPFLSAASEGECAAAAGALGVPSILKTRRLGYDGKGQVMLRRPSDAKEAFARLKRVPCILEGFVAFDYEASVVAVRGAGKAFAAYDPPENVHGEHILRRSIVPSRLAPSQIGEAQAIARTIADALDYIGVLAVELFVLNDGSLLVNEIAPRVHNSGHWTIDACTVSQFENHIRAVAGWPLGSTERHSDAVMENIIGAEAAGWKGLAARGGALHLYGKNAIRAGRKMGHMTRLSPRSDGG
jgi:5-(carboxyamino)imidazole ribonucleotide synthase